MSVGSVAHAQTPEELDRRTQLIAEAGAARRAGNHVLALELAQRAGQTQMTPSLRYFIGREQEELGQHVEAYNRAAECLDDLAGNSNVPNAEQNRTMCETLRTQASSQIALFAVSVPDRPPGLTVVVNGTPYPPSMFGVIRAMAPGTVRVEAEAPGRIAYIVGTLLQPGMLRMITVELPERSRMAETPAEVSSPTPVPTPSPVRPVLTRTSAGVHPGAMTLAAVGLASLGVSLGFVLARDSSVAGCVQGQDAQGPVLLCPTAMDAENARTGVMMQNVAAATLGVGLSFAAGGALWQIVHSVSATRRTERGVRYLVPSLGSGQEFLRVQLGGTL